MLRMTKLNMVIKWYQIIILIKEPLNKAVDWQEYNRELSELLTDLSKTEKAPTEIATIFNTLFINIPRKKTILTTSTTQSLIKA